MGICWVFVESVWMFKSWLYILWLAMYSSFWLRRLPRKASLSVSSAPAAGAGSAHGRLVDVFSWPLLSRRWKSIDRRKICLKLVRLQNFRQIWVYCYIFPGIPLHMEPHFISDQFFGATILIAGSVRVVWPWQAAWWPAGDSMNHWLWSSVPPQKMQNRISCHSFSQWTSKKYLPSWELTYLLPKDVLVPQSLSVRSRSRRVRRMAPSIRRGKGYESSVLVIWNGYSWYGSKFLNRPKWLDVTHTI